MPEFRFEAVDAAGRARRGLLEGSTARAVRDQLRGDGLFPTAVEPATARSAVRTEATRIAAPLLALITRQLATLVASGMPLDSALAAVAEQSDQATAARVLDAIREQVAAGEPLAAALSRFPRTFSELYRGLVAVGAETGQLGIVLSRLADYLEARQALRQEFTMALVYPALVTIIALAVIATLLLYVVPQIVAVYQQSRQTLPLLTRAMIGTSDFLRATGAYWAIALFALLAAAAFALRRESVRERAHALLLRIRPWALSFRASTPLASQAPWRSSPPVVRRFFARSRLPRAWYGRGRYDARLMLPRLTSARACRCRAPWRRSACSRPCSCTSSQMASKVDNCPQCSNARRANRSRMFSAALPGSRRWCSRCLSYSWAPSSSSWCWRSCCRSCR
jgi:hypothetical protein